MRENSSLSLAYYQFPEVFDSGLWAHLSPSAKALYPVILKFANLQTRIAFPSREKAMKLAGLKKPHTFAKAWRELKANGLIEKSWLAPANKGFCRKLFFQLPPIAAIERHTPNAADRHRPLKRDAKGQPPINHASNGHSESSKREEKDPALKIAPIPQEKAVIFNSQKTVPGKYPEALLEDLRREYGADIVEEAVQKASIKFSRYPLAYLRTTCGAIASAKKCQKLERAEINRSEEYRIPQNDAASILANLGLKIKTFGTNT